MSKIVRFLKTTGIGGLLFLLPLIVIGALIGQIVPIVLSIATALYEFIPFRTPSGIALLVLFSIALLLLLCFGAGVLARRSLGRRISQAFEKNLILFFPKYAILKDHMASSVGGDASKPQMKPVLARFDDSLRIGLETERTDAGLVAVYLPGSPDSWNGTVVYLPADRVESTDLNFGDALGMCERLGRDSAAIVEKLNTPSASGSSDTSEPT